MAGVCRPWKLDFEEMTIEQNSSAKRSHLIPKAGSALAEEDATASLFFLDKGTNSRHGKDDHQASGESDNPDEAKGAAWVDEDDARVSVDLTQKSRLKKLRVEAGESVVKGNVYSARLCANFEELNPRPRWAQADRPRRTRPSSEESEEDEHARCSQSDDEGSSLMRNPFAILKSRVEGERPPLLPDAIGLRRLRNANFVQASRGGITALQFHPTKPWVLVAGRDRTVNVFDVDGLENKLIFTMRVDEWPITSAKFSADGEKVFICGKTAGLIVWNIFEKRVTKISKILGRKEKEWPLLEVSPCGRFVGLKGQAGYIVILSATTMQVVGCVKMNSEVGSITFSSDGKILVSVGADNHIYLWNLANFQCIGLLPDDSGTTCTSVAISPDGTFLSVGSNLGIVNVYVLADLLEAGLRSLSVTVRPFHALSNLTTAVSAIAYHPSSQLMAYASDDRKNCMRLVHLPSARVFANWPKDTTPISRVQAIAFSPSSRLMAIGNDRGIVMLYSLRHFE